MASYKLPITPFPVPAKVTLQMPAGKREDGMRPPVEIALADLDDETLASLIEEFVAGVMTAAGRAT